MGITLAFIALFSWGIGDFLIQKSARKFGNWQTLFYICVFSVVALFPFVYKDMGALVGNPKDMVFLLFASVVILFAALFDFEAFRRGKLSVIEPVNAMELPVAVFLAIFILREGITLWQGILIGALMIGIFLVATRSFEHLKNIHAERGVWFAVAATIGMGLTDFLFGVGGRDISPIMINWFTDLFLTIVSLGYLVYRAQTKKLIADWKTDKKFILELSFVDNLAWVAYTFSMTYIPIAVATGISESYIAFASVLGLTLGGEKLRKHQKFGLVVCIAGAVALAFVS
jgi:drug/metabolite transporter (DMT)-like permease